MRQKFQQMEQAYEQVRAFGMDRSQEFAASKFINVLWDLCGAGAQVSCIITGYYQCCLCGSELNSQSSPLQCLHEVHDECLRRQATDLSNGTMDPTILQQISCPLCNKALNRSELESIIGRKYIEQKMGQANLRLSKMIEQEEKAARKKEIEERQYQCPLCLENFRIEGLITFNCVNDTHRFCKQCAAGSILQIIRSGKFSEKDLCCQLCKTPIDEHVIRECIPPQDFERLMSLRYRNMKVEGLNVHPCFGFTYRDGKQLMEKPPPGATKQIYERFQDELERRCSALRAGLKPPEVVGDVMECSGIISCDPEDDGFITCPVCQLETCIKGCESAHRGSTCENFQKWKEATQMSDQKADEVIRQMRMMRCPNCRNIVLKETGCNHITCRCGWHFCYVCGGNWAGHNGANCRPPN